MPNRPFHECKYRVLLIYSLRYTHLNLLCWLRAISWNWKYQTRPNIKLNNQRNKVIAHLKWPIVRFFLLWNYSFPALLLILWNRLSTQFKTKKSFLSMTLILNRLNTTSGSTIHFNLFPNFANFFPLQFSSLSLFSTLFNCKINNNQKCESRTKKSKSIQA